MILLNSIFCILFMLSSTGCVKGVRTEIVQKEDYSYLKFVGSLDSASVIIDEGDYSFQLSQVKNDNSLFKIDTGKHRIQVYKNNILVIDRLLFLENHVTREIDIP